MKKIVLAVAIMFSFQGCISVKNIKPHELYSDLKVVYSGVKYVVYEMEEEKDRVDQEGFGEK